MAESGHEDEHANLLGDDGLRTGGQVLKLGYIHLPFNDSQSHAWTVVISQYVMSKAINHFKLKDKRCSKPKIFIHFKSKDFFVMSR